MNEQLQIIASTMNCKECRGRVVYHEHNAIVYGKDYGNGHIYICENFPSCNSYVGAHGDGKPLGDVVGYKTRQARKQAHKAFDPLWRQGEINRRFGNRETAYKYLSDFMNLPTEKTHIGMFDELQCKRVLEFVNHILGKYEIGTRLFK